MTDDQKKMWEWAEQRGGLVDADGIREHTFRYRRHLQAPHRFAWDAWEERAKAGGVVADLAQLGRAVMREADQHAWSEELQAECGWADDGDAMIALALDKPEIARSRWSWLLDTDGGQVDPETFERLYDNESDA